MVGIWKLKLFACGFSGTTVVYCPKLAIIANTTNLYWVKAAREQACQILSVFGCSCVYDKIIV